MTECEYYATYAQLKVFTNGGQHNMVYFGELNEIGSVKQMPIYVDFS